MTGIFERPALLALAVVLPLLALALLAVWHRVRRARLARLGTPGLVARLTPAGARHPAWRAATLGPALALAGVAVAGPRWGVERDVVRGGGVDVVLALDASLSMLATDEQPNRLERVKEEVRRLHAMSPTDRFALLAFAGRSYILTPLTVDDGAIDLFLENLDPSVVGQAGSSLARAIGQGTDLLQGTRGGADRVLVVMSDGEAFEPDAGISVVTVGFGTTSGSTIPVREGDTVTQKRDENGDVVVTRYHPEMLRAAAAAAHGTFVDARATDKAGRVRRAISGLRTAPRSLQGARRGTPRFQWFLFPALLLMLLDTVLTDRPGARAVARRTAARGTLAAGLLLWLAWPPGAARADDVSDAAREFRAGRFARAATLYRRAIERGDRRAAVLYDYGTALLAADSLASASDALERASKTPDVDLRFRALFNLGLAHLRRGLAMQGDTATAALGRALEAYKRALLVRSVDRDAKWNYELALRKQRQSSGGGGGGQDRSRSAAAQSGAPDRPQAPSAAGGLGPRGAEELLNNAAREERDVQARRQRQNRPQPPPGGKDW